MGNKWLTKLQQLEGAVKIGEYNPFMEGVRSPSPSVNFIFGNTHLLPFGASAIFWGPQKGGKSVLINAIIGQVHQDYPDAIVLKFNTEERELFQLTPTIAKQFGIDLDRYSSYDTNKPEHVFDAIQYKVSEMCEQGANIKLIVIDSISDIMGRRAGNSTSISQQQIGDEALTIKDGLKRIRHVLRTHKIALIMAAQQTNELDPVEVMRGRKYKMAGANYLRHFGEYFVYIAANESKDGRVDILGNEFVDEEHTDVHANPDKVAHKIKVQMKDSSVGIKGRIGEFTLHRFKGVINVHEEIFRLGVARKIFERPKGKMDSGLVGKIVCWQSKRTRIWPRRLWVESVELILKPMKMV